MRIHDHIFVRPIRYCVKAVLKKKKKINWGIPRRSSVWDSGLSLQCARVRSLVGELRSCKLRGASKKVKNVLSINVSGW